MKTYKHLFEDKVGFIYNGKHYNNKSYTMNYYNLVKDISGFNAAIDRISKTLGVTVKFLQD